MIDPETDFPSRPDFAAVAKQHPELRDFLKRRAAMEARQNEQPQSNLSPEQQARLEASRKKINKEFEGRTPVNPFTGKPLGAEEFEQALDRMSRLRARLPVPEPLPKRRPFRPSAREFYWLCQPASPWGDYGDMIIQGLGEPEGARGAGPLRLSRTGPFVPPITFPAMGSAVVTATARHKLEAAGLRGLKFAPVIKDRIVKVDWQKWDPAMFIPHHELNELAPGGEPEEVLEGPHSEEAASTMEELWELVPDRFKEPPSELDVLRIGAYVIVSTHALAAFFQAADTWFETVPIESEP